MSQEHSSATEAARRLGSRDWMEPAQQRRKRWGRKRTAALIVIATVVIGGAFVIADGPRQTGLTDALGLTCGEYVHPGVLEPSHADQPWRGDGHPQDVFEPWDAQVQRLEARATDEEDYSAEAVTAFIDEVEALAEEHGAEPALAAFKGWSPLRAGFSAVAGEDSVIVGEHIETQSSSDRVSLVDPATAETTVSAALEHPEREHWEDREPVLYGVGEADGQLILQTPTARGDTDVVVVDPEAGEDLECIRLEGGFVPTRYQEGFPSAWHSVMDLHQVQNRDEHQFLMIHGRDMDTAGSPHQLSSVDVTTGEVEPSSGDLQWEDGTDLELNGFEVHTFEKLGGSHYFLDWHYGYIIFEATS